MTKVAYLDCFSGVSGDMLLGAIIDAGVEAGALSNELTKLGLEGWSLRVERVRRAGVTATLAHVDLAEATQPHRQLPEITAIFEASSLADGDKRSALAIFRRLAEAEGRIHGVAAEEIEFHEVGSLDAIVDIAGAVAGLRMLGIEKLYCSALPAGGGTARSAHGALPVPAPATLELMAAVNAPMASSAGDRPMEMVTPTGAAIMTTLATFERPAMLVGATGYGAGGRDPEGWPNVLRIWTGEAVEAARPGMVQIETNIDDTTPEIFGYVQERLFGAGAADVWFQAIQMKKNRPGVLVSVICMVEHEGAITDVLMRETSTLGVRVTPVARHEAQREAFEFTSSIGPAAVKVKRLPGEPPRVAAEFEVCRRIAEARGLPLREVYRIVEGEALAKLGE